MTNSKKAIKLRMIFMGTSSFARDILESLVKNDYNIVAVFTQPDKEAGRKKEIKISPVKAFSQEHKLPVIQPERFAKETVDNIKKIKPDIIVVAAYGKILPREVLDIPGFGCLNVHASLLPRFRGPSPIQNALLAGEKETGITIMRMDEGVDTGEILSQEKLEIDPNDTTETLSQKLSQLGSLLIIKTIPLWIEQKIEPRVQDNSRATLCQLIEREDGHIIWEEEAENIYNKYRAFQPWPGIFAFWKNKDTLERVKFNKISFQKSDPETSHQSGEVFQLGDKIGVQTLKGIIVLEEVQLEGKKPVPIKEFINGYPNFLGSILR
ncbi:MAG: methionyl-tRNA formyltransferase [Candidatus Moranbacteria bacterium]|nr:methionyl-tRNA formyltransferase [Candidatus Moranbacteria bacterium]